MADGVAGLEQKLRALDSRVRVLNGQVIGVMNDTLALWDLMLDLKRRTKDDRLSGRCDDRLQ